MPYTLTVVEKKWETEDSFTIGFKQPALKKIKYKAGQYLTLHLSVNKRKYYRPYSFSSTPGLDPTLNITVKRIPGGIVSNYLAESINAGDMIEVLEPLGDFVLPEKKFSNIFLWGAGSGITPLYSLIKDILHNRPDVNVTLVYINKTDEQIIFYQPLMALAEKFSSKFNIRFFCTRMSVPKEGFICERITTDHIKELISESSDTSSLHYICGPEGLKINVREVLSASGIQPENIFSEEFDHVVNSEQLEGIVSRKIEVVTGVETLQLEVPRGKSVLETCLDANLDLSYSCQNGTCMLCKGELLDGELKWIGNDAHLSELENNDILLCCSYPLTDNVRVRVNYNEKVS